MASCIVANCGSTWKTLGVSLHRLPRDDSLAAVWLQNAGLSRHSAKRYLGADRRTARLCSEHFDTGSYPLGCGRKLRQNATPTIFNFNHGVVARGTQEARTPAQRKVLKTSKKRKAVPDDRRLPCVICFSCENSNLKNLYSVNDDPLGHEQTLQTRLEKVLEESLEEISEKTSVCENCVKRLTKVEEYYKILQELREDFNSTKALLLQEVPAEPSPKLMKVEASRVSAVSNHPSKVVVIAPTDDDKPGSPLLDSSQQYQQETADDDDSDVGNEATSQSSTEDQESETTPSTRSKKKRKETCKQKKWHSPSVVGPCGLAVTQDPTEAPYKCPVCDAAYFIKGALDSHISTIHWEYDGRRYVCKACNEACKSLAAVKDHVKASHEADFFKCQYCGLNYGTSNLRERHKNKMHQAEMAMGWKHTHACPYCAQDFTSKSRLEQHSQKEHILQLYEMPLTGHFPFQCYCGKGFISSEFLEIHAERNHQRTADCPTCGNCFKSLEKEAEPVPMEEVPQSDRDVYKCPACDATYERERTLETHIHGHHWEEDSRRQSFTCKSCEKPFDDLEVLLNHIKEAHAGDFYKCHYCGQAFASASAWDCHKRKKHQSEMAMRHHRSFSCPYCAADFTSKKMLLEHSKKEHKDVSNDVQLDQEFPFRCHCGKSFYSKELLEQHNSKNHSSMSTQCPTCRKGLGTVKDPTTSLENTEGSDGVSEGQQAVSQISCEDKTPSESLPAIGVAQGPNQTENKCPACDATYVAVSKLQTHITAVHWEYIRGLFICKVCRESFRVVDELLEHIKKIHARDFFTCQYCGMAFASGSLWEYHKRKMHQADMAWGRIGCFACPFCAGEFSSRKMMLEHTKKEHSDVSSDVQLQEEFPFKCYCGKSFYTSEILETHTAKHDRKNGSSSLHTTETSDKEVDQCSEANGSLQNNLEDSVEQAESSDNATLLPDTYAGQRRGRHKFDCPACDATYMGGGHLQTHIASFHWEYINEQFECKACHEAFKAVEEILDHIKKIHASDFYTCQYCGLAFATVSLWDYHKRKLHQAEMALGRTESFACPYCAADFSSRKMLLQHTKKDHADVSSDFQLKQELPFMCQCGKGFYTSEALGTHSAKHHGKSHDRSNQGGDEGSEAEGTQSLTSSQDTGDITEGTPGTTEGSSLDQGPRRPLFRCPACDASYFHCRKLERHIKANHWTYNGKYICKPCGKSFENKTEILDHTRMMHSDDFYKCQYCEQVFATQSLWDYHKRGTHQVEMALDRQCFTCPYCATDFASKRNLTIHIKKDHSDISSESPLNEEFAFKCHCGKSFYTSECLETHSLKNHGANEASVEGEDGESAGSPPNTEPEQGPVRSMYKCPACDALYAHQRSLQNHIKSDHWQYNGSSYLCKVCQKTFDVLESLITHAKEEHANEFFRCQYCEQVFVKFCQLESHKKLMHQDEIAVEWDRYFACPYCAADFSNKSMVEKHVQLEHAISDDISETRFPFRCYCGRSFVSQELLEIHTSRNHQTYYCPTCNKPFLKKRKLNSHMVSEHGDMGVVGKKKKLSKPDAHLCNICGYRCLQRVTFENHMAKHSGTAATNSDIKCKKCNEVFASLTSLRTHQLQHGRTFECDFCGRQFPSNTKLTNHRRTHTNERPFICDICGDTFGWRTALRRHRWNQHQSGKPVERYNPKALCPVCMEEVNVALLSKHFRSEHPDLPYSSTYAAKGKELLKERQNSESVSEEVAEVAEEEGPVVLLQTVDDDSNLNPLDDMNDWNTVVASQLESDSAVVHLYVVNEVELVTSESLPA